MFGSPVPVRLDNQPFGPTAVWRPDSQLNTNRKARKRAQHASIRARSMMNSAAAPPADLVHGAILDHLPEPTSIAAGFNWPTMEEIQAAMLTGATIGSIGLMWNPPVGAIDPGVHAYAVATFSDMDADPVRNALLCWVGKLAVTCMVYGSRSGIEWGPANETWQGGPALAGQARGHRPFLEASMQHADELRRFNATTKG